MSRTDKTDPWWVKVPHEPHLFETDHRHARRGTECDIDKFFDNERKRGRWWWPGCGYYPSSGAHWLYRQPSKARGIARRNYWGEERMRERAAIAHGRYDDLDGRTRHGVLWDLS